MAKQNDDYNFDPPLREKPRFGNRTKFAGLLKLSYNPAENQHIASSPPDQFPPLMLAQRVPEAKSPSLTDASAFAMVRGQKEGERMKNKVHLEGILVEFNRFSENVGTAKLELVSQYQGKEYRNFFFLTVFKDNLAAVEGIALGSEVQAYGKLKNGFYEKDGNKVFKLEIILTEISVSKSVAAPKIQESLGYDPVPF